MSCSPTGSVIEVVDDGEGFDPDETPAFDGEELSEGGLGIAIIRTIADEFEIESKPGERGSRLRFAKRSTSRPRSYREAGVLQLVNVGHKSLADYATIATRGLMDEIRALAEPLAGNRVLSCRRPRSEAASRRSTTRWCRSCRTPASRSSGGSSAARTSSST